MLFAIKLSYIRPIEEVQAQLDAHKAWLGQYVRAGSILFAGPLQGEKAGFVLAHANHLHEIEKMIAEDPFHTHGLASFDIQCCEPALCAAAFPVQWAVGAKSI